ncbi:hypothetical protein C5B96_03475 [Subtercola sp. Z020]|uniref:hypothetical protein n=1 Tax=Subtercola sp. Z020 TaxID=2080582 RepID=UPI000CE81C37|nr:hypothetical protein [Subtercola sp. Z020]PPF87856.1 hypothetical protein C5B96_03475 [Subtercola sp. Z020]
MTSLVIAVAQLFGALATSVAGGSGAGGAGGTPGWLLLAGLVGAATVLAIAVVLVAAHAALAPNVRRHPVPPQNADLPTLTRQSNPAAPGHARARAPGRPAAA